MDDSRFTKATLDQAETRFQHALLANDVPALDEVIHADTRFTAPDGQTIDKATDMAAHRANAFTLETVDELDREVQVIDGVGITRATVRLVGTVGEQALDAVVAYTRTWVPSGDGWLIIAAHGSASARSA